MGKSVLNSEALLDVMLSFRWLYRGYRVCEHAEDITIFELASCPLEMHVSAAQYATAHTLALVMQQT